MKIIYLSDRQPNITFYKGDEKLLILPLLIFEPTLQGYLNVIQWIQNDGNKEYNKVNRLMIPFFNNYQDVGDYLLDISKDGSELISTSGYTFTGLNYPNDKYLIKELIISPVVNDNTTWPYSSSNTLNDLINSYQYLKELPFICNPITGFNVIQDFFIENEPHTDYAKIINKACILFLITENESSFEYHKLYYFKNTWKLSGSIPYILPPLLIMLNCSTKKLASNIIGILDSKIRFGSINWDELIPLTTKIQIDKNGFIIKLPYNISMLDYQTEMMSITSKRNWNYSYTNQPIYYIAKLCKLNTLNECKLEWPQNLKFFGKHQTFKSATEYMNTFWLHKTIDLFELALTKLNNQKEMEMNMLNFIHFLFIQQHELDLKQAFLTETDINFKRIFLTKKYDLTNEQQIDYLLNIKIKDIIIEDDFDNDTKNFVKDKKMKYTSDNNDEYELEPKSGNEYWLHHLKKI